METAIDHRILLFLLALGTIFEGTAQTKTSEKLSRLQIGGYGEAVMTRNFYSDNVFRYSHAEKYKDPHSNGQFDLPHVVIMLHYNFGKGWTLGSEIEFEHGGTEAAV